jgi:hypothetical protein
MCSMIIMRVQQILRKESRMASRSFHEAYIELGGGGGGGSRAAGGEEDRAVLERTVGSIVLDRMNGFPIGSVASRYRAFGGQSLTVLAVLEDAFGDDYEIHSAKGREHVEQRVSDALKRALAAEGLVAPTTVGFRDMLMHLDKTTTIAQLTQSQRSIRESTGKTT